MFLGFPGVSATEESTCSAGDLGSSPGLRRSPGERKGYPLQYSGLENFMDYTVHGVAKSWTRLSDLHFTCFLRNLNAGKEETVRTGHGTMQNWERCMSRLILQARILEWAAMPSSRGSSRPRDGTHISYGLLHWLEGSLPLAAAASPGKPMFLLVDFY